MTRAVDDEHVEVTCDVCGFSTPVLATPATIERAARLLHPVQDRSVPSGPVRGDDHYLDDGDREPGISWLTSERRTRRGG